MLLTLRMRRFAAHMDRDRPDADGDAGPQLVVASMNLCARWRVGARWRCRAESRVPVRGCVTVRSQNTSPAIGNAQDPKTPAYKPIFDINYYPCKAAKAKPQTRRRLSGLDIQTLYCYTHLYPVH